MKLKNPPSRSAKLRFAVRSKENINFQLNWKNLKIFRNWKFTCRKLNFFNNLFLELFRITSIIKTQTRIIEKKIIKLNLNVFEVEKGLHETQLDFLSFVTQQLERKINLLSSRNICLWTTQEYIWT